MSSNVIVYLTIIDGLLKLAFNIWSSIRQIEGNEAIPSWEEIIEKNNQLQAKIDSELR